LIMGFVLVDCTTEPTLSFDDFVIGGPGDRISSRRIACPLSNMGLTKTVKNFQYMMQIVFSDDFAKCPDDYIDHLEGVKRPMDAVAANFLRYCVKLALRKFFRIARSVRRDNLTEFSVKTPAQCDLSDPGQMLALDGHYRVRILRKKELDAMYNYTTPRNEERQARVAAQTSRLSYVTPEEQRKPPSRPCSGHLGA
jgi:hypothetical protein